MAKLTIPGRLPGLNQYTDACRTSAYKGAALKKKGEKAVLKYIHMQAIPIDFKPPVEIDFVWYEKDRRRDPDNIAGFGHKVILDALVKSGIIKDDSQRYIRRITDAYETDPTNPRIEIDIHTANRT